MSRTDTVRDLEHEVGVLIRRVKRVIGERARAVHEDLQPASYLMLSYVADHGPARPSAIVEMFSIDKGAISRQVQHLVDLGLVGREPDPADGRATLISVTPEALTRLEAVNEERRRWLDGQLRDWSDDDLTEMVRLLGRYNAALDDRG